MVWNKKGIGIGQIFIFIITGITFALIMIFGYKAITDFMHKGELIEFTTFKNELEGGVKGIYTNYGTVRTLDFFPPVKYKQICFVNMDAEFNEKLCEYDAVACSAWEKAENYDMAQENVFLKPIPSGMSEIKIFHVEIIPKHSGEEGFMCEKVTGGHFSIVLEGKGDHTEISEYGPEYE